ncbi:hypothetical protein GNQ08_23840 [Paenibacillus macerans]|uniref:Lipoprotein n=1 Tax=Paenibacillus macerans TaxID=44252 RepID=A0A6N8F3H8_PAEMA|nr:hypothetical protein [Paenibacillus macerans]MUG25403.1 hypothetical protein [Paenibacillus macerans]
MKKSLLLLSTLLLASALTACGSEAPANKTAETTQSNEAAEAQAEKSGTQPEAPKVDWAAEIKKIAESDGSATEKADSVEKMARDYKPTSDELTEFQTRIVDEFINGKYLKDSENAEYMLTNLFQSVVVERQADESQGMKKYAQDFYQNTKYVFRGAETPDSDAVKANEEQMTKAINGE